MSGVSSSGLRRNHPDWIPVDQAACEQSRQAECTEVLAVSGWRAVEMRVGGRRVVARPELVSDPEEVERLLRQMLADNRRLASFVPFVERDGTIDRAILVNAVGPGLCVVRWHRAGVSGR
jgi:hypothetical protein